MPSTLVNALKSATLVLLQSTTKESGFKNIVSDVDSKRIDVILKLQLLRLIGLLLRLYSSTYSALGSADVSVV